MPNIRRKRAAYKSLWPLAHEIAKFHLDDAEHVARWVFELCPDFVPTGPKPADYLYTHIGFRGTERLLSMRRVLLSYIGPNK